MTGLVCCGELLEIVGQFDTASPNDYCFIESCEYVFDKQNRLCQNSAGCGDQPSWRFIVGGGQSLK
jgi:hypothetical protein